MPAEERDRPRFTGPNDRPWVKWRRPARCSLCLTVRAGGGLLVWEQAGDGLHHVAQVLASAEHGTLDSAGNGAMMAKRIHFTAEDLARTRVKTTLGVAAETVDGVKRLRERDRAPALRGWRTSVTSGLGGSLREQALPLMALMPAQGPQIDIATLTGGATGIDEAVDNLLTASPR